MKILVADDEIEIVNILKKFLEHKGFEVDTALDGKVALELIKSRLYSIIFLDVNMPGLDGLDTTRRLRAEGLNRATPVIAVTGAVAEGDIAACRAAGAGLKHVRLRSSTNAAAASAGRDAENLD